MTTEKEPSKPLPDKSPGEKKLPLREGKPATFPSKRPQVEPPKPWPRKPQSRYITNLGTC